MSAHPGSCRTLTICSCVRAGPGRYPEVQRIGQLPDTSTRDVKAELDRLIKHEYFGKLNSTMELETLDFSKPFEIVKEIAPMWFSLLTTLLQDPHAQGKDYSTESAPESIQKEVYTITSMVCHSRAKVRSEHLCSLMDVYLLGSGMKRQVLSTLAGLGICHGYHSARSRLPTVAVDAESTPSLPQTLSLAAGELKR